MTTTPANTLGIAEAEAATLEMRADMVAAA
jgi:hypothetical protein